MISLTPKCAFQSVVAQTSSHGPTMKGYFYSRQNDSICMHQPSAAHMPNRPYRLGERTASAGPEIRKRCPADVSRMPVHEPPAVRTACLVRRPDYSVATAA